MPCRGQGVVEYHSRSGPAHDRAYALPHVCAVAVDRAFAAAGLAVPEAAAVESPEGVVEERRALGTEGAGVVARIGSGGLVGVGSPAGLTGLAGLAGLAVFAVMALLPAVSAAVHPYHQSDNSFLVCYAVGHVLAVIVYG